MSNDRPPSSSELRSDDASAERSEENSPTLPGHHESGPNDPTLPPQRGSTDDTLGVQAHSNDVPSVGNSFGDYELIEEIARGGMGVVFKARQKSLDRFVALKMILSGQFASEDEIRRFNAESTAAARLDHKNIIPIYDSGVHGENHFFSMKLIEGSDLVAKLKELRSNLKTGIQVLVSVCRAIHHAHQRGILHRDLKPANILIDNDGEPYVADLGLARQVGSDNQLTRTGAVVGTPSYMPPEQAAGSSDITTAADIYSLGAILYELLAGRPPFSGTNVMDTLMQVMNAEPERPSLNGSVDRNLELIALKCLSKEPKDRYATAEALADDLERWSAGEPISIRAPSFSVVARNWFRQNFGHAIWILIVGLVAGCTAGLGLWFATVQQDMDEVRSVYKEMPSVQAPWTMAPWSTPEWAAIPWMVVFTMAIMFIGFFTAALARTRNRSADLAAGISVGIISAAAAFFICFGTLCVVAMNMGNSDIEKLVKASLAESVEENEPSAVLQEIFDDYPELEPMSPTERSDLMLRKIKSDHLYQARNGIITGTLSCLFLFLTAGIAETLVAGPIVRKCESMGAAFGMYVFCSYPFVVSTVIGGVYMTGVVVIGNSGIIWNWLTVLTFTTLVVGMLAEVRKWHVALRVLLVGAIGVLFFCFFAYGFSAMPTVAQSQVDVARRLRLVERFPDKPRLKSRAVNSMLRAGVKFYNMKYFGRADSLFVDALDYIDRVPESQMTDEIRSAWRTAISNRANAFHQMGDDEQSREIFLAAIRDWPDDDKLRLRAVDYFANHKQNQIANELIDQLPLASASDWNTIQGLIGTANPGLAVRDVISRLEQSIESRRVAPDLAARLKSSAGRIQKWHILGPVANENQSAMEQTLSQFGSLSKAQEAGAPEGFEWVEAESIDALAINLRALLGREHENVSAFAMAVVVSEHEQAANLYLGSDDSAAVWVNGEQLQEANDVGRGFLARQDHVSCRLKQGENVILLKITQLGSRWEVGVQIEDDDGWQLPLRWLSL